MARLLEEAKRRSEQAVGVELRAETRYRSLFERVPVGLYRTMQDGQILDANPALLQMFGYANHAEDFLKLRSADLYVNPDDRRRWQTLLQRQGIVRDFEALARRRDGTAIWVRESTQVVRDTDGQTVYYEGICEDITDQKRAIEALEQLAGLRQALSSKILAAQEQERLRLARELHDVLGQLLTVLQMDSEWILNHAGETCKVKQVVRQSYERLGYATSIVRNLAYQLRPSVLDDLGIGPALETLATETSRQVDLRCEARIDPRTEKVPLEVETALYRIAQEALTNVVRHARATKAWLRLQRSARSVCLTVEDNGQGIPEDCLKSPKSLGLAGMRERTALLAGKLTLAPRRGGGTVVTVRIPLTRRARGPHGRYDPSGDR